MKHFYIVVYVYVNKSIVIYILHPHHQFILTGVQDRHLLTDRKSQIPAHYWVTCAHFINNLLVRRPSSGETYIYLICEEISNMTCCSLKCSMFLSSAPCRPSAEVRNTSCYPCYMLMCFVTASGFASACPTGTAAGLTLSDLCAPPPPSLSSHSPAVTPTFCLPFPLPVSSTTPFTMNSLGCSPWSWIF